MLDLKILEEHKSAILQAEIGALLFNMGKTHAGIGNWRKYFPRIEGKFNSYKAYYKKGHFFEELNRVSPDLKSFFCNLEVNLPYKDLKNKKIKIIEIMKAKESSEELPKKVFFRGCENINSGIDKGSPKEQIKSKLFIANAFGTSIKEVYLKNFDEKRQCFWQRLHKFLEKNNYYKKPNWKCIRKWVFDEIKPWYSSILSDNRFPINDITLWDQVYMTATMFKAVLADMFLIMADTAKQAKIKTYYENPSSIKWRIMGIQYDKLGLAEKGFKPAQIGWYRETARKIDKKIKALIEIGYCLGNEIYRDETGIYFLVGENQGEEDTRTLTRLHPDLSAVKTRILKIFKHESQDEFYPAIFLTKASRGLMNLTYHLEEAKDNFLQADYSQKSFHFEGTGKSTICPICQIRAFSASTRTKREGEDKFICDRCYELKTNNRFEKWLENITDETIWTSELQDKNGRIALVTLKFELREWLNGNMLNSLLIQEADYDKKFEEIEMFFRTFFSVEPVFPENYNWLDEMEKEISNLLNSNKLSANEKKELGKNVRGDLNKIRRQIIDDNNENLVKLLEKLRNNLFNNSIKLNDEISVDKYTNNNFEEIIALFYRDLKELGDAVENLKENLPTYKEYIEEKNYQKYISGINELIEQIKEMQKGSFFLNELAKESYTGCKNNAETFDDWIKQIFFGSITGNAWEDFVKNSSLNKFIDWETQSISWSKWSKDEIELFTRLLLQFLLRKNPSPARLKRIWDTTEKFFEKIDIVKMADIPKSRCMRLVWENRQNIADGEYQDGELLFWVKKGNIHLITPKKQIPKDKKVFVLKPYDKPDSKEKSTAVLLIDEAIPQNYKPYFSIIDPTPVSWQFAIPAEYVPKLIKNIACYYNENFKWVYGKLPLHIGVVIQDYKKPLYLGIKALRKIRRDNVEEKDLKKEIKAKNLELMLKKFTKEEELENNTGKYYSLYETVDTKGSYQFYLCPKTGELKWIKPLSDISNSENIIYYPNTFDFEFVDTNTRRNELFYLQGQRKLPLKKNRPYTLEEAEKIVRLGRIFVPKLTEDQEIKEKEKSISQMHNFITQLYSKYESWNIENDERNLESFKLFLVSLLVNTFKLNTEENADLKRNIVEILEIPNINDLQEKSSDEIRWIVRLFFDSFEFWHKALKEV